MLLGPFTKANSQEIEMNVDRPGMDYRSFDLPWDDLKICQGACEREQKCQAWTYVKAGVQGQYPRCWLKHAVPAPSQSNCCASGVKGGVIFNESPEIFPKNCTALRDTYYKQCNEIKDYYAKMNCQKHGYSGCALDVVSCFTPFLPSHIFPDTACGKTGYTACATKIYDRYLECLKNCNENAIGGRLPQGLRQCGDSCLRQIKAEIGTCP